MRIRSHTLAELMTEMDLFRTSAEVKNLCFASFDEMATFILARIIETVFPHSFKISYQVVLMVLPLLLATNILIH